MFGDAKGYLITEMVWEDVADDDEPLPARSSAGVKSSNSNSVPAVSKEKKLAAELDEETEIKSKAVAKGAPVAKKVKKAAPIVQQKGMMSFFGKK